MVAAEKPQKCQIIGRKRLEAFVRQSHTPRASKATSHRECPRAAGDDGPCPYVSCRHHLYADITEKGGLRLYQPHIEPWQLTETCALDVAIRARKTDGLPAAEVGRLLGVGRRSVELEIGTAMEHFLESWIATELSRLSADEIDSWVERTPRPPGGGWAAGTPVDDWATMQQDLSVCLCRDEREILRCVPGRLIQSWGELVPMAGPRAAWEAAECAEKLAVGSSRGKDGKENV